MNSKAKQRRMFRLLLPVAALVLLVLACAIYQVSSGKGRPAPPSAFSPREGDVIFQITTSPQAGAIQLATGSKYTHCGIVFEKNGRLHVFEAIRSVSWTPLDKWLARGVDGHYVLMRLKSRAGELKKDTLTAMKKAGEPMAGKPYDLLFQWSDDKLYCSELVWKIYERGAGIRLAPLRSFKDYHLDSALVRRIIQERYGGKIHLDEKVVAPSDLMESPLLERVSAN